MISRTTPAAREVNASGEKRFLVWLTRGAATTVRSYVARDAEHAKCQMRDEPAYAEKVLSSI
jgi:hypothetical protein